MAIQKSKTLPNGITGNYWRLTNISFDRDALSASARIALFKDKATSDSGAPHLGLVKHFSFTFTVPELISTTNVLAYIYGKIRSIAETPINKDIAGNLIDVVPFDNDIANGTMV
jgi:hypothetical protein